MALADIWALSRESNNSGNFKFGIALDRTNKKNYASSRTSDMEFESKKRKHRSSFALTAKVLSSAAPFMPSWSKLANMNVARYDFACAEVNGMIYAVGGYGMDGESLSCAEVYTPEFNRWTLIESLRRPRWGCFACGFEEKLYVMGGRSSFTIGNSRFVDVYNPETHTWCEIKNGCVMVTAYAVLDKKLFCMEWKNQRKLAIFNPEDNSWKMVPVPVTGSSSIGFRFGILDGKLLFFSLEEEPGYTTLLYDPNSAPGSEWQASDIKLSGSCFCIVTMKA